MSNEVCCYCGGLPETRDHIPPKSFFTSVDRVATQLITVPACFKCNNSACSSDEVFKLISAICAMRLDKCSHDYVSSVNRTLKKQNKLRDLISKAEIIGSEERKILVPGEMGSKFDDVIRRIIKGLYYYERKEVLSASTILVRTLIGFDDNTVDQVLYRENQIIKFMKLVDYGSLNCRVVKKNVFEYRYGVVPDHSKASVWCLLFRNSLLVVGISLE